MVLDHTNEHIKLRGISVKFAWFQHPPPPPDFRGTCRILDFRGGTSIFFCIYLIIACNIDFFMAGCPLSILKKYGKCGIFLGENMGQIWDFWGHFEKHMGQLWDILKNFK